MIISGKAHLAGVIGWPVSHSLSPRLHGYWLEHYGIDGAYLPLGVRPEALESVVAVLVELGFRGFNVTLPHKQAVLELCDDVHPVAQRIGAANTIVIESGRLLGSNSDAFGFRASLVQGAPAWDPKAGPAVVLGAGGAARAVVSALVDAGVPALRLLNRTQSRAEALAASIGGPIEVRPWEDAAGALEGVGLLVNTTSLGMTGHAPLEIGLDALPTAAVVTDLVYAPLKTDLLAAAEQRGNRIVDGLGMLLHQARPGFEAWFSHEADVTQALRDFVLAG